MQYSPMYHGKNPSSSSKSLLWLGLGTVVIMGGCIGAGLWYYFKVYKPQQEAVNPPSTTSTSSKPSSTPSSSDTQNVSLCENGQKTVTCPAGKVLKSGNIKFGRWDATTCPGPGVQAGINKSVSIPLPATCIGKSTCNITLNNNLAGGKDPVPNVFKQGLITYTCN
jgi:hypothetical protein